MHDRDPILFSRINHVRGEILCISAINRVGTTVHKNYERFLPFDRKRMLRSITTVPRHSTVHITPLPSLPMIRINCIHSFMESSFMIFSHFWETKTRIVQYKYRSYASLSPLSRLAVVHNSAFVVGAFTCGCMQRRALASPALSCVCRDSRIHQLAACRQLNMV